MNGKLSFYQKLALHRFTIMRYVFAILITFAPYLFFANIILQLGDYDEVVAIFTPLLLLALLPLVPWGVSIALFYKNDRYVRPFLIYLLCTIITIAIIVCIVYFASFVLLNEFMGGVLFGAMLGSIGIAGVTVGSFICMLFFRKRWYIHALIFGCVIVWCCLWILYSNFFFDISIADVNFGEKFYANDVVLFAGTLIALIFGVVAMLYLRQRRLMIAVIAIIIAIGLMLQLPLIQQQIFRWYVDDRNVYRHGRIMPDVTKETLLPETSFLDTIKLVQ